MGLGSGLPTSIGIVPPFFPGAFPVSAIFDVLKGVCDSVSIWINLLGLIDPAYSTYCSSNSCCPSAVHCMLFDFKLRVPDAYMIAL